MKMMKMFNKPIVVFDVETTGLNHKEEQIIELAAVKIHPDGTEEEFHSLVALEEGRVLPEFITNLTGITEDDLKGQPDEYTVVKHFKMFFHGSVLIAQNAGFDLSFLSRHFVYPREFICTRYMTRWLEMDKSASLKEVTKRRGIELEGHHRALNDVEATIKVLESNLVRLEELEKPLDRFKNVVLREPDRPVDFKPVNSRTESVYKMQITLSELGMMYTLMEDSEMKTRIGLILNR